MKTLRNLFAVLLMTAVFVSCGSSPEEDGKRVCEWSCEMAAAEKADDQDAIKKLDEEKEALEAKYGEKGDASDEDKEAFKKASEAAMKDCKCEDKE